MTEQTQVCTKCFVEKPVSEFWRRTKTCFQRICKVCRKADRVAKFNENPDANREKKAAQSKAWREANRDRYLTAPVRGHTKTCSTCRVDKSTSEFWRNPHSKTGLRSNCKTCAYAASKMAFYKNREKNLAKARDYCKLWRAAHRGRLREVHAVWRAANREHVKKTSAAWRRANPELLREVYRRYMDKIPAAYVETLLGMKGASSELIEMKREQLKIKRLTNQLTITIKEKQDGNQ